MRKYFRLIQNVVTLPALVLACTTLSGCLYANVVQPLAYRSPTPGDVGGSAKLGGEVEGTACAHAVLGLVAWGDGGYAKAVADATQNAGPGAIVADVQADTKELSVLSLVYNRRCTVVHARVLK